MKFWVDRGGTFTDVVALDDDGAVRTVKLLSENPGHYADAAVEAMRRILGVGDADLPAAELRVGTTVATNALLERKGEPTLLAITRGFGDALRIGYQERPELFVRRIDIPAAVYADVLEINERVSAEGDVLTPLDAQAARAGLEAAFAQGLRSVAIVLVHGYRFAEHEKQLAQIARQIGFVQVSVSHEVAPLIKLVARGDTTVVDAYLSPVLRRYVENLRDNLGPNVETLFMQSSGGLADGASFSGKDAILSGPAGGVVGMARTALEAGFDKVIGFDMGGTSTDVAHFAGQYERDHETRVAGARLRVPMMRVHTVAAGGGSICRFVDGRFQVGPESAGAVPGPACYRRGGPLAVTDCNVLLGKVRPDQFPHVFGPHGNEPLDADIVRAKFTQLVADIRAGGGPDLTPEQAAEGFVDIAVANMANAIKRISVSRGHDVTHYTLACFGGAGGQHACKVADALSMDRVMIHPLAGVLSAFGIGMAERSVTRERTLGLPFTVDAAPGIAAALDALSGEVRSELTGQGVSGAAISVAAEVHVRTASGDAAIAVAHGEYARMRADYEAAYAARFGFLPVGDLVADMAVAEAVAAGALSQSPSFALPAATGAPLGTAACFTGGETWQVPVLDRARLAAGFTENGPLLVIDPVSTTMVEPGWRLSVDAIGNLILTRVSPRGVAALCAEQADPVRLEIFNGLFMAIAEEMGGALQHSASSVNIRERLDFSCAIFDVEGGLVANAPHMPVHLGSMGESVRTILRKRAGHIRAGDVYALNAPYEGGTHLPDITVIMPVFVDEDVPSYWVAARGHHADIGGIAPGSMPPGSRTVDEEGVLLDNILIAENGRFLADDVAALLSAGKWPSRNVAQNLADLKAQVAACAKGASELVRISGDYGRGVVQAYMRHVQANAEQAVRRLILKLEDGHFRYALDNEAVIEVRVTADQDARTAQIDFTGTSPQLESNFNAPLPVVRAAVLYVIRTLIDEAIPMNEGCLRPIEIIVPQGCFLNPRYPAAVVAGNVETSQAITDALFGALGAMAAAQGTMNNFTFGNEAFQYYETIAGGSGAGPDFDGTDVVQTHMTNSRLTDPEILETRFPVLLEAFAIRPGSGGVGAHHGGNGAVRRIRFRQAMDAGILSNRRRVPPFGLSGGASGAPGRNSVERADGSIETLGATAAVKMAPGDVFVIETPGGGGFGREQG
jgi:5-oxoprolinase (ATP-hydrolysing)